MRPAVMLRSPAPLVFPHSAPGTVSFEEPAIFPDDLSREFDEWMRAEKGLAASTRKTRLWTVGRFIVWLRFTHRKPVDRATEEQVREYLSTFDNPATRNRVLSDIRGYFLFARRTGRIDRGDDPTEDIDRLREPEKLPHPVHPDDRARLFSAAKRVGPRCYVIVSILAYTGLRRAECADLRWEDIDFSQRMIHVAHGKGGKERYVPMNGRLTAALETWKKAQERENEWVFPGQYWFRPIHPRTVWEDVKAAREEAGIYVTPHDWRHTFGTEAYRASKNPYGVAKVMGHTNIQTTQRYALVLADEMREHVEQDYETG